MAYANPAKFTRIECGKPTPLGMGWIALRQS